MSKNLGITLLLILLMVESRSQNKNHFLELLKYNNVIKVNDLSFFGKFIFDVSKKKKTFSLLYDQDTLRYVAAGPQIKIKNKRVFKVNQLSDTLNILTSKYAGRYFVVDTLYFFESMCVIKTAVYRSEDADVKNAMPQKVDFDKYTLINNNLTVFTETFQPRTYDPKRMFVYNESIEKYLQKKAHIIPSVKPSHLEIDDINLEKLQFFRSYIAH